jgi:hypothetical protein
MGEISKNKRSGGEAVENETSQQGGNITTEKCTGEKFGATKYPIAKEKIHYYFIIIFIVVLLQFNIKDAVFI